MSKEAMKLALEALEGSTDKTLSIRAMKALREALADQPAPVQQEPLTIPDDVVEAAQLMQDGDYRGPLFLARKVFDWVAAHGTTKGGAA